MTLVGLVSLLNLFFPQTATAAPAPSPVDGEATPVVLEETALPTSYHGAIAGSALPEAKRINAKRALYLTVTAYSSSIDETDGDPFTTASGTRVHDGTLAHNSLPIGTRVRFPDAFGEKIFIVEDRLNPRYGPYMADIWMPSKAEAIQWGARVVKMEIL